MAKKEKKAVSIGAGVGTTADNGQNLVSIGAGVGPISGIDISSSDLLSKSVNTSFSSDASALKITESSAISSKDILSANTTGAESITPGMTDANKATEAAVSGSLGKPMEPSDKELVSRYTYENTRLANFTYNDGSYDAARRGYLRLKGETSAFKEYMNTGANGTPALKTVFAHLISGYTSIIILSLQENHQEKQHIMPTVGDRFAATFAGKEPQILSISGLLPFDDQLDNEMSWYTAFLTAFKNFIRASKLAQSHCYLQLVFPNFTEYNLYPISFSANISSEQDNLIPFVLSAVVVDKAPPSVTLNQRVSEPEENTKASEIEKTAEEVKNAESETTKEKEQQTKVTKDPAEVGKQKNKKNFMKSFQEGVNKVAKEINKVAKSKTVQSLNKSMLVLGQARGAVNMLKNGSPYGQRNISKISGGVSSKYRG